MKKAKILLTALVVMAITGGIFAFKAQQNVFGDFVCTFSANVPVSEGCTIPAHTTDHYVEGSTLGYCTYSSAPYTAVCTATYIFIQEF